MLINKICIRPHLVVALCALNFQAVANTLPCIVEKQHSFDGIHFEQSDIHKKFPDDFGKGLVGTMFSVNLSLGEVNGQKFKPNNYKREDKVAIYQLIGNANYDDESPVTILTLKNSPYDSNQMIFTISNEMRVLTGHCQK